MSKTNKGRKPTNHRAILANEGPARNPQDLINRQIVTVRALIPVQRPERSYEPGETFRCTYQEALGLVHQVHLIR